MAVSRVDFAGRTLIDLTGDTVVASALLAGLTAHGADGALVTGTLPRVWYAGGTIGVPEDMTSVGGGVMRVVGTYDPATETLWIGD